MKQGSYRAMLPTFAVSGPGSRNLDQTYEQPAAVV
jgi:hypothetical protein